MNVLTVIGNRPQFVKAAAVSGPLRERHPELLVHTGQHYDDALSRVFFDELGIPRPDRQLDLGGGSNTTQTARMLAALEPLIEDEHPDAVLVYGDTNSTLAGALAGAQAGVPVVHVEAGMRSGDRTMPEELNRLVADDLSELLLCSTPAALQNLRAEGAGDRAVGVGDVMADIAMAIQPVARSRADVPRRYGLEPGGYVLATAHRAGNVDDPERLRALVELLEHVGEPLLLPLHPRTAARLRAAGLRERLERAAHVVLTAPLGYGEFTALLCQARALLTDSGGVQKEAYLAGVPCVTMRPSTEWIETVDAGWNVLVDLDAEQARAALHRNLPDGRPSLYGDGKAGSRVVAALETRIARSS